MLDGVEICKWLTDVDTDRELGFTDKVGIKQNFEQMDLNNRAFHVYNMWSLPICFTIILMSTAFLLFFKQSKSNEITLKIGFLFQIIAGVIGIVGGSLYIRNFNNILEKSQVSVFGFKNSLFDKINGEISAAVKIGLACYLYLTVSCIICVYGLLMIVSMFVSLKKQSGTKVTQYRQGRRKDYI